MKSMTDSDAITVLHSLRRVFEYQAEKSIAKGYIKHADKAHRRVRALDKAIARLEEIEAWQASLNGRKSEVQHAATSYIR